MSSACTPAPRRRRIRSLADKAGAAWLKLLLRRRERRAAHLLDGLGDYLLKDMGLSRGELATTTYGLAAERSAQRRITERQPADG